MFRRDVVLVRVVERGAVRVCLALLTGMRFYFQRVVRAYPLCYVESRRVDSSCLPIWFVEPTGFGRFAFALGHVFPLLDHLRGFNKSNELCQTSRHARLGRLFASFGCTIGKRISW